MSNDVDQLKASATNFGFAADWSDEVLKNYGSNTLSLSVEAARSGLSAGGITEILKLLGPVVLEFLVELLNRRKMKGFNAGQIITGDIIQGVDASFIEILIEKFLPIILERFLPQILENFGPQLIQWIMDILIKNMPK